MRSIIEAEQPAVPRRIYPRFARMLRQTPEVGLKILRRLVGTGMAEAAQTKKNKDDRLHKSTLMHISFYDHFGFWRGKERR